MDVDGASDDDFPPNRNATDIFGNIDFDEAAAESDDEVAPTGEEAFRELSASLHAGESTPARRPVGHAFYDSRRLELSTPVQQSPMYSPDKSLSGYDEFEEEGELLIEPDKEIKRKGKRKKSGFVSMSTDELLMRVSKILSKMEKAAMDDLKSNENQQPALEKLKMLEEVEEACIHREMQPLLLNEGLLGVLKSWIEPLADGTLPNIKIRETVLKILLKLPIDTADHVDRKNLKISEIGSRVMFLSRIEDETRENKRMAFELVQRWVRPIFEEARQYDEDDRIQSALSARKRRLEAERIDEEKRKALKPGDPHFKYVATRPQPNRDYVIKPDSKVNVKMSSSLKRSTVLQRLNKFKRLYGRPGK